MIRITSRHIASLAKIRQAEGAVLGNEYDNAFSRHCNSHFLRVAYARTHPKTPTLAKVPYSHLNKMLYCVYPHTYDHRVWRTGLPVHSAVLKPHGQFAKSFELLI